MAETRLTVLITGATSGFGEATARRFAREGHRIVITGRREDRLEILAGELKTPVLPLCFDVRDKNEADRLLSGIPGDFAEIDVLVNNAGLALGIEKAHEASFDDWETMIDTNCKGLAYVTRKVLPGMVARGRGHIVNIGSIAATYAYPGGNVYGATKAFVRQFSRNLRAELAGTPVRVTVIEPGLAETEFSVVRFHGDAERAKKVYEGTSPLSGEDVADAIHWAVTRPPHVNVDAIELMPVCQASAGLSIHRK
ncbi:MAG: SDR family oxidoreductase [Deltaproteobacteria bacterium]|nr:SDR family oxidoreductase [Deltaproteobacteria bacterium]